MVILVVVIVVMASAVCAVKRKSLLNSVDLNDVVHCNVNPSYDTVRTCSTVNIMRYILHHHVLIILLMEHSKLI